MRRSAWLIGALVLAGLCGAGAGIMGWQWYQSVGGERRPAFSLPAIRDGETRRISEWDGQIIVLNFWASWCKPCREEIPRFVELQERFGERGVQFVGVAVMDRREAARALLDELDVNYPNMHGMQKARAVHTRYADRAKTLPYTVVIDRDGFIRHVYPRVVEEGDLAPVLDRMSAGG